MARSESAASPSFPVIVTADWLRAHADEVILADVRWYLDGRSGRQAYRDGHLPGAVFVDVDTDLAAPPSPAGGRHPLPDPADFAAALSRLGIGDGSVVVAYDDAGGSTAARLALHWGVLPVVTPGTTAADVRDVLLRRGLIRQGASVVFVSMDADLGRSDANYVHVERMA